MTTRARGRGVTGLAVMLLAWCPCAFALNPGLDVSQYAHRSWKIRDGFPTGLVHTFAQTRDGYLWLGTESGLVRFDGVKPVSWQPPAGQHLPSAHILRMLAARDGTLWIATANGLASWRNGKFTQYPELAGEFVYAVLVDRSGSVWAGAANIAVTSGRLCEIRVGSVECHGDDGSLGRGVFGLHEDRKGNLWAGASNGLWRWMPGPSELYPIADRPSGIQDFVDTDDDGLLIPAPGAVRRLLGGKFETAYPFPPAIRQFRAESLMRDREGGLWIGTVGAGIVHVHQGRTDAFRQPDGLSGDGIERLFEDREGSIWVATTGGLDRFRDVAMPTFSVRQGLSNAGVGSILGAKDGSVWFTTADAVNRWNNGQFTVYRDRQARGVAGAREISGTGVPEHGLGSLFQDRRGRIWVSTGQGVGYLENDRFVVVPCLPGGPVFSMAEGMRGNRWLAYRNLGLYRLSPNDEVQPIPWAALGHQDWATALAADRVRGGVWLGFFNGGVAWFSDGQIRATYGAGTGLGEGRVADLQVDPDGTVWAATEGGLSRLKDGHVATLTSRNGLPCDTVVWLSKDDSDSFWLYTPCGLIRIEHRELAAWIADPARKIKAAVFDSSDGVLSRAYGTGGAPQVTKAADGRLWFATPDGASVIDPLHLPVNKLPPPVQIEQVIADHKTYTADAMRKLPALTRDLEIDYTALSLVAPEKDRFRYKLEGYDQDWQDVGTRRQAFYTNLGPRNYRFRVMASNNSGMWNEAGASFDFSVAPAYYQTTWFLALIVAGVLALLAGLYQLRLRYLKQQFNIGLEARVGERTRIARDLHDTLLQSFQGTLLKFYAVSYLLPDHPEAQKKLNSCIEQARAAIAEGRDAVQGLRSSTVVANDLARAIGTFGEGLADLAGPSRPEFSVHVEGASRDLPPLVRDEVYHIACESLRNAFRHAQAKRIEVEFRYDQRRFRMRVVDNGKGIDPAVLNAGGRAGHHGLPGINERAELAGGKLSVWSRLESGTEIELTIPASIAYPKSKTPVAKTAGATNAGKGTG